MIDVGANLTSGRFRRDLPQVLRRAADAGVEAIVVTGTSVSQSRQAVQLARRHSTSTVLLLATVGVHPHDAKDFDDNRTIAEMRELINGGDASAVVAVGECGLDFNRDFSPREAQLHAFRAQVALACELKMPLFLHEREAHAAFLEVLSPFAEAKTLPPTVVHCFTGEERDLRAYLALGLYIGLTGFICMEPRGLKVRAMASQIPLDRLMIETDAPFMYPYKDLSTGGKKKPARCEPKDLAAVVQTLAQCYNLSEDEIRCQTTENARRFFRLEARTASDEQKAEKPAALIQPSLNQIHDPDTVVLDGGSGEGGGQLLRVATALAAVMHRSVQVHSIRANRKVPGLRSQHLVTIELVSALSTGGVLTGGQLNSTELTFDARGAHLEAQSGVEIDPFSANSRTGGSVALMIQGALPVLAFRENSTSLALCGGTHVGFSPPVDFMQVPLRALLSRFGFAVEMEVTRRMFYPGGGSSGKVRLWTDHSSRLEGILQLRAVDLSESSTVIRRVFVRVTAFGSSATETLAEKYLSALKHKLLKTFSSSDSGHQPVLDVECIVETAGASSASTNKARKGGQAAKRYKSRAAKDKTSVSALVVLETSTDGLLSVDRTLSTTGRSAEQLATEMAFNLQEQVKSGVCVDEHLADNAVVFMALAQGTSRLRVPCKAHRSSQHLETALEIASRLTGATFRLQDDGDSAIVEVDGIGLQRPTGGTA